MYKKILATEWNEGEKIKIALKQNKRNSMTTIPPRRQEQLRYLCTVFCKQS
jgi:hypothetical protein